MKFTFATTALILTIFSSCDFTSSADNSPGTYHEVSKKYCADSSKYLLTYRFDQGAWDGGRTSFTTILKKSDSLNKLNQYSFSSLEFDKIYWQGNDTQAIKQIRKGGF